jgi:hypothetical protein
METSDCLLKNSSLSKAKKVLEIFQSNPDLVMDIRLCKELLESYDKDKISLSAVSCITQRLWRKGLLIRTPTQLSSGYFYTFKNKKLLEQKYNHFLIPYSLENKVMLRNEILKSDFDKLGCNFELDLGRVHHFPFVRKYGPDYFQKSEVQEFLASNCGFLICDGHIKKTKQLTEYCFRYENDAISFNQKLSKLFPLENTFVKFWSCCYRTYLCSVSFAELMIFLGVPKGNKVFQAFKVSDWIYYGPDNIKLAFLSAVFGGEGSAPSNNKWRIQFVISKCEKEVSNLLFFVNQIRAMLFYFGISSSHIQLRTQKGNRQFNARFYIKGKDNLLKFYKLIGFAYASEKQEILEDLLRRHNYIN